MEDKNEVKYSVLVAVVPNPDKAVGVTIKVTILKDGRCFEALGYGLNLEEAQKNAILQAKELAGL